MVAAALFAVPASAGAATYCVAPATGCNTDLPSTGFQTALTQAGTGSTVDTIRLGAATYNAGPYSINTSAADSIVGAGVGQTIITSPANAASHTMLDVFEPSSSSPGVVSDLTITVPANGGGNPDDGLKLVNTDARRIAVISAATTGNGVTFGGGTIADSTIQIPTVTNSGYRGVSMLGDGTITGSDITAPTGVQMSQSGTALVTVSRSTVHAIGVGVTTDGGNLAVDDSVIDLGTAPNSRGIVSENPNGGTNSRDVDVRHTTIVGGGSGSQGLRLVAGAASVVQHVNGTLADSVISGPAVPIYQYAAGPGPTLSSSNLAVGFSNYDASANQTTPGGNGSVGGSIQGPITNLAPGFVNAGAGDFRLAASSALIDAGRPDDTGPPLARAGNARVQDGNGDGVAVRDIGAYEFPDTVAPSVQITGGPAGTTTTEKRPTFTFSMTPSDATATFLCSFDGAAFASCAAPSSPQGSDTPAQDLSVGQHSFSVLAKDGVGNSGTPATASFTVLATDTTPPQTKIKTKLAKTRKTKVKVAFSSSEAGSTFTCKLDGAKAAACRSPKTFKGLKRRKHTLRVWATDKAGNRDATPAILRFKVLPPR